MYARLQWIDTRYLTECPFCHQISLEGESIEHFLVSCPAWSASRNLFLGNLIFLDNLNYMNLLGGSRPFSGLSLQDVRSMWCPYYANVDVESDLQGTSLGMSLGDALPGSPNYQSLPGCVLVAKYLQYVVPLRLARLRPLLEAPRADAVSGMAALSEDDHVNDIVPTVGTRMGSTVLL